MNIIQGDIFNGEWDGICHVANLYHTMGGGIARIIARDFPEALKADKTTARGDVSKLGTFSRASIVRSAETPYSKSKLFEIFNLYGQMGIGNNGHPMNRNARYDAIHDGMFKICEFIVASYQNKPYVLGIPYKMASDRAGGSWGIIEAILSDIEYRFPNIEFHIYKL
jgi:hypothetical protein